MNVMNILEFTMMVCGMVGSLMIAYANWKGFYVFLFGSIVGTYWALSGGFYSIAALEAFFMAVNCLGIWNHIIKEKV